MVLSSSGSCGVSRSHLPARSLAVVLARPGSADHHDLPGRLPSVRQELIWTETPLPPHSLKTGELDAHSQRALRHRGASRALDDCLRRRGSSPERKIWVQRWQRSRHRLTFSREAGIEFAASFVRTHCDGLVGATTAAVRRSPLTALHQSFRGAPASMV